MASSVGFNHVPVTAHISILFESTCSTTSPVLFLIDCVLTVQTYTCPSPSLPSAAPSWVTWMNYEFCEVPRHFERESSFLLPMITGTVFSLGLTITSLFTLSNLIRGTPRCSESVGCFLRFATTTGVLSCFGFHILLRKSAFRVARAILWILSKDFRNSPEFWKRVIFQDWSFSLSLWRGFLNLNILQMNLPRNPLLNQKWALDHWSDRHWFGAGKVVLIYCYPWMENYE